MISRQTQELEEELKVVVQMAEIFLATIYGQS